jgi:hypothetical protein
MVQLGLVVYHISLPPHTQVTTNNRAFAKIMEKEALRSPEIESETWTCLVYLCPRWSLPEK